MAAVTVARAVLRPRASTGVAARECSACFHWHSYDMKRGRCRRYPPMATRSPGGSAESLWPETHNYDVCGEYKPKV
jgi:hypothetical protein